MGPCVGTTRGQGLQRWFSVNVLRSLFSALDSVRSIQTCSDSFSLCRADTRPGRTCAAFSYRPGRSGICRECSRISQSSALADCDSTSVCRDDTRQGVLRRFSGRVRVGRFQYHIREGLYRKAVQTELVALCCVGTTRDRARLVGFRVTYRAVWILYRNQPGSLRLAFQRILIALRCVVTTRKQAHSAGFRVSYLEVWNHWNQY